MRLPGKLLEMPQKLSEYVRGMIPSLVGRMSRDEAQLAVFLRGNEVLFKALKGMIETRMGQRAKIPEPSDALACRSMIARDRELQWFLSRLECVYRSSVDLDRDHLGEPPA